MHAACSGSSYDNVGRHDDIAQPGKQNLGILAPPRVLLSMVGYGK
jgi:hypothetical protein